MFVHVCTYLFSYLWILFIFIGSSNSRGISFMLFLYILKSCLSNLLSPTLKRFCMSFRVCAVSMSILLRIPKNMCGKTMLAVYRFNEKIHQGRGNSCGIIWCHIWERSNETKEFWWDMQTCHACNVARLWRWKIMHTRFSSCFSIRSHDCFQEIN